MRARELRTQSVEQLQQTKDSLESELLRYVGSASVGASGARRRRETRRDLARVLTLLGQK